MATKTTGYDPYLIGDRELILPVTKTSTKSEDKSSDRAWVDRNPKLAVPHREYEHHLSPHRFQVP